MDRSRLIRFSELNGFLGRQLFAVIHFDAEWDSMGRALGTHIDSLIAEHPDTSFGLIDIDAEENWGLLRSINLRSVPCCGYYRGSELVALVIGMGQNVDKNIQLVRDGKTPDGSERLDFN
ncbi:hypothetical protein V2O64_16490 [Verrucomicrobiaceae bacterium 227]